MTRPSTRDRLCQIRRIVASYPDAPPDIESYTWLSAPRYWEHLRIPIEGREEVIVEPRRHDQHAGVSFRVGWNERERVVALWLL